MSEGFQYEFLGILENDSQFESVIELALPEPDISSILSARNNDVGDQTLVLTFESNKGFNEGKKMTSNVQCYLYNIALAFDIQKGRAHNDTVGNFNRRDQNFDEGSIKETGSAPWQEQECVVEGDDTDLAELMPFFRPSVGYAVFIVNKSSIASCDPDNRDRVGKQNVGMYRVQVQEPKHLGSRMVPDHDIAMHFKGAQERCELPQSRVESALAVTLSIACGQVTGCPQPRGRVGKPHRTCTAAH